MNLSRGLFALSLPFALSACGDKGDTAAPVGDDTGGGTSAALDCATEEGVRFTAAGGAVEDWTAAFAAGSAGAPAAITVDQDGVLDVCGGTWVVNLSVSAADLVVRGDARVSAPVFDGGGSGPIVDLTTVGAQLVVEDLEMTNGLSCFGSAVRAADFATECDREAGPLGADITLRRVHVHGMGFDIGGGAIGTAGSTVTVEDTLIADNEGHAIFAVATDVTCSAAAGLDAGMHDNTKSGVWIAEPQPDAGNTVVSDGCDWGGNGQEDVRLGEDAYFDGFGQDASFVCDAIAQVCE